MRDIGKHAYTFINRKTGTAIRLVQRPEPLTERIDPDAAALRKKVMTGKATPAEEKEFEERQAAIIREDPHDPVRGTVYRERGTVQIPGRARISGSVQCAVCGEMVAEHRARVKNGKIVCIPCAGEYSRGWLLILRAVIISGAFILSPVPVLYSYGDTRWAQWTVYREWSQDISHPPMGRRPYVSSSHPPREKRRSIPISRLPGDRRWPGFSCCGHWTALTFPTRSRS